MGIQVSILGANSFAREGLKHILVGAGFEVSCMAPDQLSEIAALHGGIAGPHIVIIDMLVPRWLVLCREVAMAAPGARIALLAESEAPDDIVEAMTLGVAAILDKSAGCGTLIHFLRLAALGERVLASRFVDLVISNSGALHGRHRLAESSLSVREKAIVNFLIDGLQNKQIARLLGLTDSTVKVHIKAILRKLKLGNRTQVAIWAAQSPMATEPPIAA